MRDELLELGINGVGRLVVLILGRLGVLDRSVHTATVVGSLQKCGPD
jgi:hypothetical protein